MDHYYTAFYVILLLRSVCSTNLQGQGVRGTGERTHELWEQQLPQHRQESGLNLVTMEELGSAHRELQTVFDLHLNLAYTNHPHDNYAYGDSKGSSRGSSTTNQNVTDTSRTLATSVPSIAPSASNISPIRIVYETTELELNAGSKQALTTVKETILPQISAIWSSILSVTPVVGSIPIPTDVCYGLFPNIPPSIQQDGISDADIVIFVNGISEANGKTLCGPKTLASASFCNLDQVDRPVIGFINFCLENLNLNEIEKVVKIGVHEVGHALGWNDDLFKYFRDRETGEPLTKRPFQSQVVTCVDGSVRQIQLPAENTVVSTTTEKEGKSTTFFEIVTPSVQLAVRNQFGCQDVRGARLENQPTKNSCIGAHFDERLYYTEVMSPIYSSQHASALSPITVALLEDSGFYDVDYSSPFVKNSPFGLGAGCDFVFEGCIDPSTDKVKDSLQNYFCDSITAFSEDGIDKDSETTCDPTFTNIAYCDLFDFSNGSPEGYTTPSADAIQHFNNPNLGVLFTHADYCPIPAILKLDCTDSSNFDFQKFYPGEQFGESSRCFNTEYRHPQNGNTKRGACLKTHCNLENRTLEVYLDGEVIICEADDQVYDFPWTQTASFKCPPLATACPEMFCPGLCSSKGMCNYAANPPRCDCFDAMDTSQGCYGRDYQSSVVIEEFTREPETFESQSNSSDSKSAFFSIVSIILTMYFIIYY